MGAKVINLITELNYLVKEKKEKRTSCQRLNTRSLGKDGTQFKLKTHNISTPKFSLLTKSLLDILWYVLTLTNNLQRVMHSPPPIRSQYTKLKSSAPFSGQCFCGSLWNHLTFHSLWPNSLSGTAWKFKTSEKSEKSGFTARIKTSKCFHRINKEI